MIVVSYKPGRLGNSIFLFATFIAFSLKYKIRVLNPSFGEYVTLFPAFKNHPGFPVSSSITSSSISSIIYKFSNYLVRILNKLKINGPFSMLNGNEVFDMDTQENISLLRRKIFFVYGWLYRTTLINDYRKELIELFTPDPLHMTNIDKLIQRARNGAEVLVGMHIRHEDYKQFMGGKYYYSVNQYIGFMHQVKALFPGKSVRFLVCTNGKIDPDKYNDLDVIQGNDHFLEDMYTFSKCDFILGPPSTYTMWASFYGSVPLHITEDPEKAILLENFKVFNGQ